MHQLHSERYLEDILLRSPAIVFLWRNTDGWPVEFVSPNVSSLGYTPDDFYSGRLRYADLVHPEDLQRVAGEVKHHLGEGDLEFTQEYRLLTRSRDVRWVDDRTVVRKSPAGEVTHLEGVVVDITERRRAQADLVEQRRMLLDTEERLREAKDRAEAADRAKNEFLDIASHELRTPLTALLLNAQSLRAAVAAGRGASPVVVARIERQARRMDEMVRDLLDVSRLERGRMLMNPRPLELSDLVASVVEDFRSRDPERMLSVALPAGRVMVLADATRIEQVIANYLDNAFRYTPSSAAVRVTLEMDPRVARVSVADLGLGIPPERQPLLFQRFYRVSSEATRRQPGLGLGLYICRMIVQAHGGEVGVKSQPGEGSTFFFTLPLEEAAHP
ncbi:MAG: PAS domain-containing sensor histidine kinase [Myxococcales bacterium]|nr:PAS domain-containing sensor histidine kinase [Myxococcales bacterium]